MPSQKRKFARILVRDGDRYLVVHNIKLGRNRWEFPGGKCDPTDTGSLHTALRELEEETSLRTLGREVFVGSAEMVVGPDTCAEETYTEWVGDFWLVDIKNTVGKAYVPEAEQHKFDKMRWVTSEEFAKLPQIPVVAIDIARKADRLLA